MTVYDFSLRLRCFLLIGLLLATASGLHCTGAEGPPGSGAEGASALRDVDHFVVYFDGGWQGELASYEMAIIDPDAHAQADVEQLAEAGTLPIAYVNVGEIETYRSYYSQVQPDWILGKNPNWEDHYYIDAREAGWQDLMLHEVIPGIMDKGYEGLFLDMVDTAMPGLHPETRPGMVELIRRIRETFPDALLIMNHGFFLADEVGPLLDGILAEGVFTRYNFDTRAYERTPVPEQQSKVRILQSFQDEHGVQAFTLNYYAGASDELRAYARERARFYELPSFTSTVELDTIPKPIEHE